MLGSWDDFCQKYGFGDGDLLEQRDFEARSTLVHLLNQAPGMQKAKLRAVEYDRPGMHNSCLVIILPAEEGLDDKGLLARWLRNEVNEVGLPNLELERVTPDHPLAELCLDDPEYAGVQELVTYAYNSL